jgi:phage-related baseplate assembly protein
VEVEVLLMKVLLEELVEEQMVVLEDLEPMLVEEAELNQVVEVLPCLVLLQEVLYREEVQQETMTAAAAAVVVEDILVVEVEVMQTQVLVVEEVLDL